MPWKRYEFEMVARSTGVVEVFVPDDDGACMDGSDTEQERDAIRAESAKSDLADNAAEIFEESRGAPEIVSFVETNKPATAGRL